LAAMHTGGGSGRSAEAGDGSECSLSMRMRLSCHAVTIMRMRLGEGGVLERHVPILSLRSEAIPYSNQYFLFRHAMLAVKLRPMPIRFRMYPPNTTNETSRVPVEGPRPCAVP
jgi:hypothetical protein